MGCGSDATVDPCGRRRRRPQVPPAPGLRPGTRPQPLGNRPPPRPPPGDSHSSAAPAAGSTLPRRKGGLRPPRRPLQLTTSPRPSLRSDRWSPSSEYVVAFAGIRSRRQRDGRPVLGRKAIASQHPHDKPIHCDRSPAPLVHAASREIRIMLRVAYWQFVAAFREAAHRLRHGDRLVRFPTGAFPPPLPCLVPTG